MEVRIENEITPLEMMEMAGIVPEPGKVLVRRPKPKTEKRIADSTVSRMSLKKRKKLPGGIETVWQVELDRYATAVLERHWPKARRHSDIRDFFPDESWKVDIISLGFPCQDISYAGKGEGLAGERSGLYFEAIRVVRALRPRYVLVENTAALLTRGLDRVLAELAQIGLDAEWECLLAHSFGAPHLRERCFSVAYADPDSWGQSELPSRDDGEEQGPIRQSRGDDPLRLCDAVPDTQRERLPSPQQKTVFPERGRNKGGAITKCRWWDVEPSVRRVVDGIPDGVDGYQGRTVKRLANRVPRVRCLGNAVVPQIAQYIGQQILEFDSCFSTTR